MIVPDAAVVPELLLRTPHTPLLDRAWELRDNLTACDAVYLAVAEALGGPAYPRCAVGRRPPRARPCLR